MQTPVKNKEKQQSLLNSVTVYTFYTSSTRYMFFALLYTPFI